MADTGPTEQKPASPAAQASPAAPTKTVEKPKPSFHVYERSKDQHVVGEGCWCMPQVQIVDGQRIVVHKRS